MAGPLLHLFAGGVAYYETFGQNDLIWKASNVWNAISGWLTILWYHNLWVNGHQNQDAVYNDWNQMIRATWYVTLAFTGYLFYKDLSDQQYPLATTVNIFGVVIGLWFTKVTDEWEERQANAQEA